MAGSKKTAIIEYIYDRLVDPTTGKLTRMIVTNDDIVQAIRYFRDHHGSTLSEKNPANFMKDIIRGRGASGMWPEKLKALRIGGRQITGDGKVFEFEEFAPNQTEPFPNRFGYQPGVASHRIQSISMPLASKELGRDDETYLIQVAVKLAVVETHFALFSPVNVIELSHLQIGIKLRLCEVDSMFAASYLDETGQQKRLVITAEAKKKNQRILEDQVVRQAKAAFQETTIDYVVPIAMVAAGGGIYIAEFVGIRREDAAELSTLELASEVLYVLEPSVKGI